jgi:hypothetical protein
VVGWGSDRLKAGRLAGSSAHDIWEPGSAMVPTFLLPVTVPTFSRAEAGDLPLAGDGGGEP